MDQNFYRLVIDFQFHDHEIVGDIVECLEDALLGVLDPEHEEDEPCARQFLIAGKVVTEEYSAEEVASFAAELKQQESVDDFLSKLHFKDYPPSE